MCSKIVFKVYAQLAYQERSDGGYHSLMK
jgi:hypothetical protein